MQRLAASLLLIAFAGTAYADGPTLQDLRGIYETRTAEIHAACSNALVEAVTQYGAAIASSKQAYESQGNLDGVLAAKKETDRLAIAEDVPAEDAEGLPSLILRARNSYRGACAAAEERRGRALIDLTQAYASRLEAIEKEHVRERDLQAALAVREERQRADFILADLQSRLPNKDSPAKTQGVPAPQRPAPAIHIVAVDPSVKTDIGILAVGERMGNNRNYRFSSIPKELDGLRFVRMEARANGDYLYRVQGDCHIYVLVVTRPTDGRELVRDGWKKTRHTLDTDTGDKILVYEKTFSDGNFTMKSTGNWAYMLAGTVPIIIGESNN